MQRISLLALCAAAAAAANPVSKVVQLISDLQAKVVREGEEAQKVYDEFAEWCEDRSKKVGFEIKTGTGEAASLKAEIESAEQEAASLSSKIEETADAVATDEADLKAATAIRAKEQKDFEEAERDLVDIVGTLQRAIGVLEREMRKHGASMVQLREAGGLVKALNVMVDASMLGTSDAAKLTALVQDSQADDDDEPPSLGAPAAAQYKGHSGDIIDTLDDLLEKSKNQLDATRKKETSSKHNFAMLKQSLEDEIKFSNQELADAKKGLAAAGESKARAEGDLAMTSKDLSDDKRTLDSLHQDCMTRSSDFEAETKSRGEELKALAEAKRVIQESTSGATTVAYGLDQEQEDAADSFLQVVRRGARGSRAGGRLASRADLAQFEVVRLVRELARKTDSKPLSQLAVRITSVFRAGSMAGEDPFAKVKDLIRDMIERLGREGHADASHKAYCDKELAETAQKKADSEADIEKMTSRIDSMASKSAMLKEEVATLQKALADMAKSQAEMTRIRQEEHATFKANQADTQQGLEGVKTALQILRDYYAKDADHDAAEGAGSGIVGLLEVVESDFSKNLAEMQVNEQTSASNYERESQANAISKAEKEQSVKYKNKEIKSLDQDVAEATNDRESAHSELAAVMEYSKKIDETCVAKPETYSSRASRRQAEIEGLKEALEILRNEAALLQRAKGGSSILRRLQRHKLI